MTPAPRICAMCPKPLPPSALKYPSERFCSAPCARKFHGTELPVHKQGSHMVAESSS